MNSRRLCAINFFLLAFVKALSAQETVVSMTEVQGAYAIDGRFIVEVSTSVAWDVLTDYDHISDFVPSMKSSHIISRDNIGIVVEQKAAAKFLFFSRNADLLLNVYERPPDFIQFEDLSHKDFKTYEGSWKLESSPEGLLILYSLNMESVAVLPGFIKRTVVRSGVVDLLEQVKSEMLKRAFNP